MEALHFLGLFISFLLILYKTLYQNKFKNLPPCPPSLPILGHFHLLKGKSLTPALLAISTRYGPILSLRLGCRRAIAVSTPSAVEECFTKNDVVFANRPHFPTWSILEYNYTGLASSPYGPHWRNLRRLVATEIFSSVRTQMTSCIRAEEVAFLARGVLRASPGKKVDMSKLLYMLSFNLMTRLIAGYRYFGEDAFVTGGGGTEVTMALFYPETGVDLVDFFPLLRFFSIGSRKEKALELLKKREDFINIMIDENMKNTKSSSETGRTLIDTLLSLQESELEVYTNELIYGLVTILLTGGTQSTGISMASTVSHLISHPKILNKARAEIDANVSQTQLLDETHLPKLPYLHCIINESLRIGPVGAVIPLHNSSEDCTIGGYNVPRDTMLFVNVYALHKNPEVWADPGEFKPERFEGIEVEKGGPNFMPFGLGRRKCPGWSLAMKVMALTLGTLIQCFEWEGCDSGNAPKVGSKVPMMGSMEVLFRAREEFVNTLFAL